MKIATSLMSVCVSAAVCCVSSATPEQEPAPAGVTVFESGADGYDTFRIPAIVRAANGDLLAFCEGRVKNAADGGDIDLVMRRSSDGGDTWGEIQLVADNGNGVFGNPAPVVERTSGDVVLLLVQQDASSHEGSILRGDGGHRTPFLMRSTNHGASWSEPESLAATCDRETWGWYATGPCHAIQLTDGPHAGRIVVPANHSSLPHGGGGVSYNAHLLLSDDGGRTWRIGATDESQLGTNDINPNESSVAELPGGTIYINSRDQGGRSPATRAHTSSSDGGTSFVAPFVQTQDLPAPVCQASVLSDGARILLSAPSKAGARERLAIRLSSDRGVTWHEALVIDRGPAAYSDLVRIDADTFGVLYEAAGYRRIRFVPFTRSELSVNLTGPAAPE